MAEPNPSQKFRESEKATDGKKNSRLGLKLVTPATMIQPIVPMTPTQRNLEILPICVIRRYSKNIATRTTPMARKVVPPMSHCNFNAPSTGTCKLHWRAMYCVSRLGMRYALYLAKPIAPEAIESGALNDSCQIKRNETNLPRRLRP